MLEIDGHDYAQIIDVLDEVENVKGKPCYIIAHTVKGKGVSFMEHSIAWHGVGPSREEADRAIAEIRARADLPLEEPVR